MVSVAEQEIQEHFSRYLDMTASDDIMTTCDGEAIATLSLISEAIRSSIAGPADWHLQIGILLAYAPFDVTREERLL